MGLLKGITKIEEFGSVGAGSVVKRIKYFRCAMIEPVQIPTSTARIRFQDCDPFNHLNNGRYTDYFLNAREDHLLEHYDLDIYTIARTTGRTWVVSESHIAYLRPAMLMEEVLISSQLIAYSLKHVQVEMQMWDRDRKVLKSLCWMSFIHFDLKTNKVAEHSEEYIALFAKVCLPVAEKEFGGRVKGMGR